MNSNKENKTPTLRFTLGVDTGPDSDPFIVAEFNLPEDAFNEYGMCAVCLPGKGLGKGVALAARVACQAIDKALKRHIERGCRDGNPEILETLIDPMEDLEKEKR